ncbi:unnamed protein product [Lampetra fluviatilis]
MERRVELPAKQRGDQDLAAPPPPGRERRTRNECLGDLLAAIAALAAVLQQEDDDGTPKPCPRTSTATASCAQETEETRPAQVAAIFTSGRDGVPKALSQDHTLKKRLTFVREYAAAGGDWEAFRHRFAAACDISGWIEKGALRVLPTALDDEALVAFDAIPDEEKSTLSQALVKMGSIYAPPSNKCQKFAT